ncbi:hypothetical protein V6N13_022566 [Hibiscus sabdariffa]
MTHENKSVPIRAVVDYAQLVVSEYKAECEFPINRILCSRAKRWDCPPEGLVKINVDAAFVSISGDASIGIVARNSHGLVIDARAHKLQGVHTAETAEACAFTAGLKMAVENEWAEALIEGDSMAVINKLNAPALDRSLTAAHLREAYAILSESNNIKAVHVGREANRVAHSLAQWGLSCNEPFIFSYELPDCIMRFVIDDAIYG